MFMAQCFRFGGRRCSPLNWALVALSISHVQFTVQVEWWELYLFH
ncbi:TPA: acetyltransferase [Vibrio vulnificus]|nr:acetyltransferase [Vibrio vulnificus]